MNLKMTGLEYRKLTPGLPLGTLLLALSLTLAVEPAAAKDKRYKIGEPSAQEQLMLEYINRARANAKKEANRLTKLAKKDSDIAGAVSSAGVRLKKMRNQFGKLKKKVPPLAFNKRLIKAARLHTLDMKRNDFSGHQSSNRAPGKVQAGWQPWDRAGHQSYNWASIAENVFAFALSPIHTHAAFEIDWAAPGAPSKHGMQNPPGHRLAIHNATYREVGIGVKRASSNTNVGPWIVTYDFGRELNDRPFITGVVYQDKNRNKFYDMGEGIRGVRVEVDGADHFAITSKSGGYAVPVPDNGVYLVKFRGKGLKMRTVSARVKALQNKKVDYRVPG